MRPSRVVLAAMLLSLLLAGPALAAWPNQPTVNLPVCIATGNRYAPSLAPDGAGGAFIAWYDYRNNYDYDVYAQHVLASGVVDPAWPANGRLVCNAANNQQYPAIISDGAGGAIVTWQDGRSTVFHIYAQHVLANGALDPAWPVDGRALCTAAGQQTNPVLVADGAGGAMVTWQDSRSGAYDIYAQHVLAGGAVDPAWPVDGRALCTATGNEYTPVIISDGAAGAIVCWTDNRGSTGYDIYAQHVLASGAVDPGWIVDGRGVCVAVNSQLNPTMISDGAGGALIAWQDARAGGTYDIYAQHLRADGFVDAAWPSDGRGICTQAAFQFNPTIASDGAGGAIIAWHDLRNGNADIYAQHALASGTVDPAWTADGRPLCTAVGDQTLPVTVADGSGGAYVTWYDLRSGTSYDLYQQRVLASGALDASWPADGRVVSSASAGQGPPLAIPDGAGGTIVAWLDGRNGWPSLYAQRVARYGYLGTPEAEIVSVKDVPADNGGKVKLSWNASYLEADPYSLIQEYRVFRSVPPNLVSSLREAGARVVAATESDASVDRPGELLTTAAAGTTYYWEYVATVPGEYLSNYSYLAPTAEDSTSAGAPTTAFMIQARTFTYLHWESLPMSGYSVDNLPPYPPAPFLGTYAAGLASLHWAPDAAPDVASYRLYRGTAPTFVPGPASFVAATADTAYIDAAGGPYYYRLTAVDIHGNESASTLLLPSGVTAVVPALPRELALAAPTPNPARGATTLRWALPHEASVRLALYDVSGRRVRVLAAGVQPAGEHASVWDLRDGNGQPVGAGLYFARLEAEGRTLVQRVMALQ